MMTDQIHATARAELDRSGGTLTAYLVGELDPSTVDSIRDQITSELASVRRLVLNLAEVTFCDSSGLRLFLVLHHLAVETGAILTLQDPTPTMRRLLKVAGLIDAFPIHGIG